MGTHDNPAYGKARLAAGRAIHWVSDQLHLPAHWVIGDPDWRARNG